MRRKAPLEASALVEVRTSANVTSSSSFILELGKSRCLQIPAMFDEKALERLLAGRPLTRVDATNREGETERRELTLCRIGIHGCEENVIELP